MGDELLPCPFCGGRAEIKEGHYTQYAMCQKCDVMGPNLASREELADAWNTRAQGPALGEADHIPDVGKKIILAHGEAVAWIVYAENGNTRFWTKAEGGKRAQRLAAEWGTVAHPLYAHPTKGGEA